MQFGKSAQVDEVRRRCKGVLEPSRGNAVKQFGKFTALKSIRDIEPVK